MKIFAIDPGTTQSAYVEMCSDYTITWADIVPNDDLLCRIHDLYFDSNQVNIVCEQVESFGMAVGKEVFQTVHWIGRFHQQSISRWLNFELVPRRTIKMYWCKSVRATDSNIWQSMTDLWGPPGTKKEPGKLYGIKSHQRSALAIAGWKLDALGERNEQTVTDNH